LQLSDNEQPSGTSAAEAKPLTESDVLRCIPGLRALLLRLTRNPDTVNDLAQEVILAVILAIRAERVREPAALAAYVAQTARNMVMMAGRKKQPLLLDELPEMEQFWGERTRTPLENCEAADLRDMARAVLSELPTQRDRDLITAFYEHGLDKPELMQRFGLTKEQFDRVISRARGRMRELLLARMNGEQPSMGGNAAPRIPSRSDLEAPL
jgi:RNA polymerase sigma factor (sigma-70 family)